MVISHEVAIVDDIVNAGAGSAVDRVPQVIGKELSRWLADESLRKTAADKGKALAKERFDWSKIAVRVLSQYAQVIHTYKSSNR